MAASCLATMHELEDVGIVFPHHFRKLRLPSLNMVVCSFVSFCVDIPHVHGNFLIITKLCLHKVLVKNYHLTLLKFLSGTNLYQIRPPLMDINWIEMK